MAEGGSGSNVELAEQKYNKVVEDFKNVTDKLWTDRKSATVSEMSPEGVEIKLQIELFRDIMALMQFKFDDDKRRLISENLSYMILSRHGLLKLIEAVVDIDETSEKLTTLDQRCQALGNVVAYMPQICCPLPEFYDIISTQLFRLLLIGKSNTTNLQTVTVCKIATAIIIALLKRNRKLCRQFVINTLNNTLDQHPVSKSKITINESIEIINSLIKCRFDCNYFQRSFAQLFYIGCLLEGSVLHLRQSVFEILTELLNNSRHPEYLIDDALFTVKYIKLSKAYCIQNGDVITLACTSTEQSLSASDDVDDGNILDIRAIDRCTQLTVKLIDQLKNEQKTDTFLMLIEKLGNMRSTLLASQKLIHCSLIDCLQESASKLIPQYPSRSIHFVNSLLKNACALDTNKFALDKVLDDNAADDSQYDQDLENIATDSKSFALEFLDILLGEQEKLTEDDIRMLKQCVNDLKAMMSDTGSVDDKNRRTKLASLIERITQLSYDSIHSHRRTSSSNEKLEQALKDLNDPLMSTRAHALGVLKQLFYAKDKDTLEQSSQIVERLKVCLSDDDSYLYLSAINTFAALATIQTEQTLPILIDAFLSESRTINERVNVGEIIVQLSKRLGDMSPVYADQIVNCMLYGLKSDDATIRVSWLSNLGQFSAVLKFSLHKYIVEIVDAIKTLLQSDPSLDVKRASVMYFHLVLNNMDKSTVSDLLKMGRMTLCGPVFRERLLSAFDETIEQTQDFTDSAYTSHEHREDLLLICDRARSKLNQLLLIAVSIEQEGSSTPTEDFENALTQTIRVCTELKHQLQITALDQADELFKLTDEIDILNKLKNAALAGDRNLLDEYSECFNEHAERVQEVCRLLHHVSSIENESLQIASKNREACLYMYSTQLLSACQRLCMNPASKVARENVEVFLNLWLTLYSDVQQLSRDISELLLERNTCFQTTGSHPGTYAQQLPAHHLSPAKHVSIREDTSCPRSDQYSRPATLATTSGVGSAASSSASLPQLPPPHTMQQHLNAAELNRPGSSMLPIGAQGPAPPLPPYAMHNTATHPLDSHEQQLTQQQLSLDQASGLDMTKLTAPPPLSQQPGVPLQPGEEDPSKPNDPEDNDIVRRAKAMSQMAFSMYQFTHGEGELKTTQDLFTQAEFFAEEANKFYKVVRAFTYQVPSGMLKKELMEHLAKVPAFVQQLQFSVKNSTVGKAATFNKNLMTFVSKTVNSCLTCSQTEPQAASRWTGDYDATRNRVSCPQTEQRFDRANNNVNIKEDEDCLYLNVFVPQQRQNLPQRLPVVVYIHGGEFKYGGKDYYHPNILLQHDVVLVVPNYRLGVLGFMSTDDNHSPGNYGLRDQIAALRWVQSEIHAFGGDANMVTIFGHDAGAISVSILMLSTEARGLFNRSISSGGTVFTPWAFQEDPTWQARDFGRFFNCHSDSKRLVRCLRDKSAAELMTTARVNRYHFRPVIDFNTTYPLLKDWPYRLYQNGDFAKVPYLCGLTRNEGALDYYLRYGLLNKMSSTRENLEIMLQPYMRRYANVKVVAAAADYQYIQRLNHSAGNGGYYLGQRSPVVSRQFPLDNSQHNLGLQQPYFNIDNQFVEILGDFLYVAPTDLALRMHSRSGFQTYLYVLTYQGTKSFGPLQREAPREILRDSYGVTHFDDTFYVLPSEYNLQELDPIGKQVATSFARCIHQFINPTIAFGSAGCNFKSYNYNEQNYLVFDNVLPRLASNFRRPELMSFWNDFILHAIEFTATPPPYFPYREYKGFQAATWSMLALILIVVIVGAILGSILCINKRKEQRTLKYLGRRDRELEDRYNNQGDTATEHL